MVIHACTIIARNYLASARVLYESFTESNPSGTLSVLIIDDLENKHSNGSELFEILHMDEIGIESQEVLTMAALYNVTEFATAVKPWLLQTLLERWDDPVIYLDPDIMVFRSLERIYQLSSDHDIVITPHSSNPIPRDKRRISESEVLAVGVYNLGFIGVGVSGVRFLEFWKERLRRECISDPVNMRFVDQRWVDFAPAMFNVFILKEPTYNVAYWNLHGQSFKCDESTGRYLVNGQQIHFFHFSGYDPRVPELLSKYQGGEARILFSEEPDLKKLCDFYSTRLCANGVKEASESKYAYLTLDNGMQYDHSMRNAYREALIKAEDSDSDVPPNPFLGSGHFLAWLNSPVENGKISRYLKQIYMLREDLRFHFPDANGPGISELLEWCWGEALKGKFDPRLIPSDIVESDVVENHVTVNNRNNVAPQGIQVAGYFKAEMGVGELGRNTLKAIQASGIPYSTLTDTDVIHRQNLEFIEQRGNGQAVNIVCANADSLVHFAYRMGPDYFKNRYTIGVWAWELEEFPPEFDSSFEYVDEVWACSEFTRDAIATRSPKPVFAMPITIAPPKAVKKFDVGSLGIPDAYKFLYCFDLLSIFERKNPLALIDAFTSAFNEGEGPVLIIKALNGDKRLAGLERIKIRARDRSDIIILDKYLDHEDNVGLFNAADCYVSLHRSEGLGLTIAEAMSLGKPVIATAYSGNMDFMTSDNSYLIPFTYGEVPEDCEPYRAGARWADPDLSKAAETMRFVFEHQDEAAKVGELARISMLEKHTPGVTASFVSERYRHATHELREGEWSELSEVEGGAGATGRNPTSTSDSTETTGENENRVPPLIALAGRPVTYDGQSRFPKTSRFFRKILRRLLLVRDDQQHEFNLALAMGTEHLARLWNEMSSQMTQTQLDLQKYEQKLQLEQRKAHAFELRFDILHRGLSEHDIRISDVGRITASTRDRFEDLLAQFDVVRAQSEYLKSQLHVIPYMTDPEFFTIKRNNGADELGYESVSDQNAGYANFEDLFRGPEKFIQDRQRIYLGIINSSGKIIDVGSGRGEFLDALREAGLSGLGVDIDESMVTRAVAKGHQVIQQDAISFLGEADPESIATIFSAQFIEHIDFEQLRIFVQESYRSLCAEGVLIMETVNPYSVPAFRTFWTDLTHQKPIFPEVLLLLVREAGFNAAKVIFPNGCGTLEIDRWIEGEYTVIARR